MKNDTNNATKPIAQDNFENGVSSYWYRAMNNLPYSGNPSTNYSVSPTHAYRFELHNSDSEVEGGKRAELEGAPEPPLQERIYDFCIYLPNGGAEDYALDKYDCDEIIAQWHNNPDPGEEWTMPPLALITTTNAQGVGHYTLMRIWDDKPLSTDSELKADGKITYYDLGPYEGDKGKWVNWSLHVKWGWLVSQNPKIEVYKDGVLILNLDGLPNMMNDQKGVNQQFGIYKWEWDGSDPSCISRLTRRVIYFDDVSVLQSSGPTPIAPTADFNSNVTSGNAPLAVQFNDLSENADQWDWNFGDGNNSTLQSPMHTYFAAGNYTVTLTVSNENGTASKIAKINVTSKSVFPIFPGCVNPPKDLDGDGLYEDINGNGRLDFADDVTYFNNMAWITQNGLVTYFDYNLNGRIDFSDVVKLFNTKSS